MIPQKGRTGVFKGALVGFVKEAEFVLVFPDFAVDADAIEGPEDFLRAVVFGKFGVMGGKGIAFAGELGFDGGGSGFSV